MKDSEHQGDYELVVSEFAKNLLLRLEYDSNGTIIDYFQLSSLNPWQAFLYYGVTERALLSYTPKSNKKLILIHVQPEALSYEKVNFSPVTGLLAHIVLNRAKDVHQDKISIGDIFFNGQELSYQGANPEGCETILLCDFCHAESPYLQECIKMCEEMHTDRIIAIPLMFWSPDEIPYDFFEDEELDLDDLDLEEGESLAPLNPRQLS